MYKYLHISRTFNDNKKMMHQQIINRNKMSFVDSNATTPLFYINTLLKFKILSSYLWKLCCFIHHIYTQDTTIKNAYERQNYKSYSIFLTIYTTKFVWSVKLLKGNLASAIKVTFEPSMAIH